jgi:hypothetical protein
MTTHRAAVNELARWIKSSYSGSGGGNCVEVACVAGGHRAVRDSKMESLTDRESRGLHVGRVPR